MLIVTKILKLSLPEVRKLRDPIELTATITSSVSFGTDDVNLKVARKSFENRFYSKAIQKTILRMNKEMNIKCFKNGHW